MIVGLCRYQCSTRRRVPRQSLDVTEDALGDDWLALELFLCLVKEGIVIELVVIKTQARMNATCQHLRLQISSVLLRLLLRLHSFEIEIRLLAVIEAALLGISHLLVPWGHCWDLFFGQP